MSSEERANRPFSVYGAGIGILGFAALALSWAWFPPTHWWYLALVSIAAVLAEAMAVALPGGGSASLSYPLSVAATALLGPTGGGIVAALSGVNLEDVRQRRPLPVYAFNMGQVVLCAVTSGWAYVILGGHTLLGGYSGGGAFPDGFREVTAVCALVVVALGLNAVLTASAISLLRTTPVLEVWRASIGWALPLQAMLGLLGFAIAQVLAVAPASFVLFLFPLLVARQLYQRYVGLRDAYLDTVRSLVAAIEAKDPYTRGHSERVAEYAVLLGRARGMTEQEVERLEFAALLHDLGKVGIRASVLGKPSHLDSREFDEIRTHPEIAARILERVPYLADIVPAVVAHHERVDGNGYSSGLRAEDVPVEARVLAVADSYDAMTSERPYRAALSHDEAVAELRLGAGTQFDPEVVASFLGVIGDTPERRSAPEYAHPAESVTVSADG